MAITVFGPYPATCPCCDRVGLVPLIYPEGKHLDLRTGCFPIEEWGASSGRGWVSDPRFGSGPVIKRANRAQQRARGVFQR